MLFEVICRLKMAAKLRDYAARGITLNFAGFARDPSVPPRRAALFLAPAFVPFSAGFFEFTALFSVLC